MEQNFCCFSHRSAFDVTTHVPGCTSHDEGRADKQSQTFSSSL